MGVVVRWIVVVSRGGIGLMASRRCSTGVPRWEGSPIVRSVWEWCRGVEKALDELAPVCLVRCFMNPMSKRAVTVDGDCGDVLEKKA